MGETRFVEMELLGPGDQAVGFVEGFRLGARAAGPVWYVGREQVDVGGFLERLRQRLHVDTHVILPEGLAGAVRDALAASPLVELEVGTVRAIDRAELGFRFEVFSRDEGAAVRRVIEEDLPEGVRLEGYEVSEETAEDARGVELYTPVHEYVLSGRGRYVGEVPGVIELAHRLADQAFIHPERIRLEYAP